MEWPCFSFKFEAQLDDQYATIIPQYKFVSYVVFCCFCSLVVCSWVTFHFVVWTRTMGDYLCFNTIFIVFGGDLNIVLLFLLSIFCNYSDNGNVWQVWVDVFICVIISCHIWHWSNLTISLHLTLKSKIIHLAFTHIHLDACNFCESHVKTIGGWVSIFKKK